MKRDIDDLLRRAAPEVPFHDEHRRHLLESLRADRRSHELSRDRAPRLLALGILLFALVVAYPEGRIGSDAFEMDLVGGGSELLRYVPVHGHDWSVTGGAFDELDAQSASRRAALYGQFLRARELELLRAWCFEYDGREHWNARYRYGHGDEASEIGSRPFFFPESHAVRPGAELDRHLAITESALRQYYEGRAEYIGSVDRIVDGLPLRCERWLTRSDAVGDVIYWIGAPHAAPPRRR